MITAPSSYKKKIRLYSSKVISSAQGTEKEENEKELGSVLCISLQSQSNQFMFHSYLLKCRLHILLFLSSCLLQSIQGILKEH